MIEIIYEDNSIIVCIKPAGTLSERSESAMSLPRTIERERALPELFTVHRLDREVSGVMVYAKERESAASLSAQISDRRFEKEYLAITDGIPEKDSDTLCDLLFKDSKRNKSYVVDRMRRGVKEASLEYLTLKKKDGRAKLLIKLHTGRTHQIRVQLGSRGCSISGDRKYGSKTQSCAISLCSHKISFTHPKTKEHMSFTYTPVGNEWSEFESK